MAPLALAPLALALEARLLKTALEIDQTFKLFKSMLSAKQLADDASDWLSDLKNGIINPVNLLILQAAKDRGIELDLRTKPEIIYLLFAESAGPQTAKTIINLGKGAQREAGKLNIPQNSPLLRHLISPLTRAATKALNFKNLL